MIDPLSRASNPLVSVHRWLWRTNRLALMRGLALAMVVPLAGVALLGLSGWFITAAGAAGLLGLGVSFDVFRPSAGVRFLALTRTAARYGERLLTHDATLRNLATLRVHLLRTMTGHGWPRSVRLRGSNLLNRITADVDTLDGLTLRLLIPIAAAVGTVLVVSIALALLTDARIALWSLLVFVTGTVVTLWWSASSTVKPARRATAAMQALRARSVDLLRARTELAMAGRLLPQCEHVMDAEQRAAIASRQIDAIERRATFALSLVTTLAAAIAFALGAILAQNDLVTPAQAALGFFAVLALAEAVRPLNQGLSEFGRMLDAARRIDATLQIETPSATQTAWPIARPHVHESVHVIAPPAMPPRPHRPRLDFHEITYRKPGAILPLLERCSLSVASGETVALSGPSGCGKSTVLLLASGLLNADSGSILIGNQTLPFDHEPTLRQWLSLLPQRSALFSGTVRDNLALARPTLSDGDAWRVLKAVALDQVMGNRQGLDTRLLESGSGLSGGERRRLALARVLLRDTPVLLLDEPTEGLDHDTATAVLAGIQAYRPDTTRLIAAHRTAELAWADRVISLDAL